jgi:hypothetical protein
MRAAHSGARSAAEAAHPPGTPGRDSVDAKSGEVRTDVGARLCPLRVGLKTSRATTIRLKPCWLADTTARPTQWSVVPAGCQEQRSRTRRCHKMTNAGIPMRIRLTTVDCGSRPTCGRRFAMEQARHACSPCLGVAVSVCVYGLAAVGDDGI